MSAREALEKAMEQGLDLVKISPTAVPPVCKLMDYGKFKFRAAEAGEGGAEEPARGGN